jgi:hypothetical protein
VVFLIGSKLQVMASRPGQTPRRRRHVLTIYLRRATELLQFKTGWYAAGGSPFCVGRCAAASRHSPAGNRVCAAYEAPAAHDRTKFGATAA